MAPAPDEWLSRNTEEVGLDQVVDVADDDDDDVVEGLDGKATWKLPVDGLFTLSKEASPANEDISGFKKDTLLDSMWVDVAP